MSEENEGLEPRQRTRDRKLPAGDLVYSEADVAEMRMRWEQSEKERSFNNQLASLSGKMDSLPSQIREIARNVFMEMQIQQATTRAQQADRSFMRSGNMAAVASSAVALAALAFAFVQKHS